MRTLTLTLLAAPVLAAAPALVPTLPANGVGDPLPEVTLEAFSQTKAETLEDFTGRAVLFEFFAYW